MQWKVMTLVGFSLVAGSFPAVGGELSTAKPEESAFSNGVIFPESVPPLHLPEAPFVEHEDPIQFASCESQIATSAPAATCTPTNSCSGGLFGKHLKYPTVDLTGFAQIDAIYFDQSDSSLAANGDIQDFAGFRRARLAAKGQLAENVGYYLEMDFAFPGRPSFMDVWVEVQKVPVAGNIRIGQFRQPLSMESLTSVRDLMFLERALPFAFIPFRQIGVMSYNSALDDRVTYAGSVYRFPTDTYGNAYSDNGYGTSYRFTGAPVYDPSENQVVHVGFGYDYNAYGKQTNRTNAGGFRQSPEVGFTLGEAGVAGSGTGPFLTQIAPTGLNSNNIYNIEAAYAFESFLLQSEFFAVNVDANGGNYLYTGAYAYASYVLTGEKHKYNPKAGVFGRVIPDRNLGSCGWGAWELAGRWSYIDLRDGAGPYAPPAAGTTPALGQGTPAAYLTDLTLGVNWYWNANAKMQFNYIHNFQDIAGGGPTTNLNIFALRTQFDF